MDERVNKILDQTKSKMDQAVKHLEAELTKIRAGKATPQLLESLSVDYYGAKTPLTQAANINNLDARTLVIQPWDKSLLQEIEKAILAANLGFTPVNDGSIIRISVPPLTEDRRKDLVKKAKAEGEHCKVTIRTARKDANEAVKILVKSGLEEDEGKDAETRVQKITDEFNGKVDSHLIAKEKDIMSI